MATDNNSNNNSKVKSAASERTVRDLSIQQRIDSKTSGFAGSFWFGAADDEIAPWWSPARDRDLREFYLRRGNDILQGANSSMVKKFKAMNWILEGPEKIVEKYQPRIAEADFGQSWSVLIGKTLQDYHTQDQGAFWELIGRGDPAGPIRGPVLGMAHLDSALCQLTGDPVFPVIFNNAKSKNFHKLHATRVVHMVDMPSPNEVMNNIGFCATSRVIASSQVLMKLAKYKNEKLSDLPPTGLLLFNNIQEQQWLDGMANYEQDQRRLGQDLWKNIMTFFSLDPSQQASVDFTSFAELPDQFDEEKATTLYVNIVALAYGVDVREFWPMSSGPLGTGQETTIQHQKAKGKGVGDVISTIERAINWKVLPPSVTFKFDFQDDEEDALKASIAKEKIDSIMAMWQPPTGQQVGAESPVSRDEIRQMLADNTPYFSEDFLQVDTTNQVAATDTDREKAFGPIMAIDRTGRKLYDRTLTRFDVTTTKARSGRDPISEAIAMAEENYKKGNVSLDDLIEFRLGELFDDRAAD